MITFKQFIESKKLGQSDEAKKFARNQGPQKIELGKTSIGHQPHASGTGAHQDKRTRRKNTRHSKNRNAIRDSIE